MTVNTQYTCLVTLLLLLLLLLSPNLGHCAHKLQAMREAAIRREAVTAAAQEMFNNDGGAAAGAGTCVICFEKKAEMMSDVCHRITVCNNCSEHMIVCPHCDQHTTFTKVFF